MNLSTSKAMTIALVRGAAFAAITGFYILADTPLKNYLWCVYIGFFLTTALGTPKRKLISCLSSLAGGYLWGALYMLMPGWLMAVLPLKPVICMIITEFIITACLLFIHLRYLSNTLFNFIPAIFAAIATLFAAGQLQEWYWCALSTALGMLMAYGTDWIIHRLASQYGKK